MKNTIKHLESGDFVVLSAKAKTLKRKPNTHTIYNTDTGLFFDTFDDVFYPENLGIDYADKDYLTKLISDNPDKFINCILIEKY